MNSLRKVSGVIHLSRIHSMMLPDFIRVLWFNDLFVIVDFSLPETQVLGDSWDLLTCGKTLVSLTFPFLFSPTLDRPKEVEWFKYQLLQRLLLRILGYRLGLSHARAHAAPRRTARTPRCDTFASTCRFLYWFYLIFCYDFFGFFVEFDPI